MNKKCRECGYIYKVEDQEIKIKLNHKDIEAIEDVFFCDLTDKEYERILPKLKKVWEQICDEEDKWGTNK